MAVKFIGDYDPDMQISKHFTLRDLCVTSTGVENIPDDAAIANLTRLGAVLDQIWDKIGHFTIASAFRSQAVQNAIKGGAAGSNAAAMAATLSRHTVGDAADLTPTSMPLDEFFTKLYVNEGIREQLGQIVNKAEGGESSVHITLPYGTFDGTMMYVNDAGQYVRFTPDEITDWLASNPVSGAAIGVGAIALIAGVAFFVLRYLRMQRA